MFMQQIIINNTSGYLCKDMKINKDDFTYLYNKKMIIELNSLQEKKYKSKYFISEVGYLFLKLGDYEERYNIVNKYINLRSNMSFMNKDYIIKDGDKMVAKVIYKSSGVYSLKDVSKYGFLKKNL